MASERKVTQASMPAGIDAQSRLRRTVRVYRANRFGLAYRKHTAYSERFWCRTWHVGWWCVNVFTERS